MLVKTLMPRIEIVSTDKKDFIFIAKVVGKVARYPST